MKANPRKRGSETPVPEPKRQCVALPDTRDDDAQGHPPSANVGHVREQPESGPSVFGAISTNAATSPSASELGTEQAPGTQPVDSTAPKDTSHPQPTNTGDRKNLDNQPTRTQDTQKKIMFMTLSRCRVAVYPVQVFPDLIQQTSQDMQFRRREPGGCIYRSDLIRSRAGQFHILVSHEILGKLGRSRKDQDCVVVPTSLAIRLFVVGDCHLATSIFWPTRGSVTHIRKGCDVVWESSPDWVLFLKHLSTIRPNVPELCSLQTMLFSYPVSERRPGVRHEAPHATSFS
ncbi:uncharacterized protein BDZ83DRAFT_119759 [Colletotrichum acutatum]|uniref:Uncharacterized protein n=1 Tax=Glomerella acutata TaxID=27357 RepID=A0AAD8X951_GLOAC|nr:uncharacterized protein BDZ83DRAFT_119759 [Colletotrichum acutatum]KAK1711276.1 hypothetical protein BDZ83DRAFT_119759 [Colletotrichum acutatum]